MSFWEIALRLCAATFIGGAIGLNRDLHGKPTGVRTLGLVSLGSALIMLAVANATPAPADFSPVSRVIQGVLTGIGFLGAGVILRDAGGPFRVHGLTTAACTWLTACIGMVCGLGDWRIVGISIVLIFILLILGGPLERWFHKPRDAGNP